MRENLAILHCIFMGQQYLRKLEKIRTLEKHQIGKGCRAYSKLTAAGGGIRGGQ